MMWGRPFDAMYGWGDWGWFGPFHLIVPLLFWSLIIAAVVFLVRRGFRWRDEQSIVGPRSAGLDVLEQRYARGEINRDEYLQKKADIAG